MSISAVSMNATPRTVFESKISTTKNEVLNYKSNTGTTIGAITGGVGAITWLANLAQKDLNEEKSVKKWKEAGKTEDDIQKLKEYIKKVNEDRAASRKWAVPFAIIAGVSALACGILIDQLRNKKAQETEKLIAQTGIEYSYMNGADIAENGMPYYKSNQGTKYGALLGAACGLAHGFMQYGIQKNELQRMGIGKLPSIISSMIIFALGGLGLGTLTDSQTNKKARQSAIGMKSYNYYNA